MQRHRHQTIGRGCCTEMCGEAVGQCGGHGESAVILELRNQAVERKRIDQCCPCAIVGGRMLEARATDPAAGGGVGAYRTGRFTVPGQIVPAPGAKRGVGRPAAQKTGRRHESIKK